jgi:hypothetical protein
MKTPLALLFAFISLVFTSFIPATDAVALVDHAAFGALLKKHVTSKGLVDYKGLKADEKPFNQCLETRSKNAPTDKMPKNEQMSYWINAYTKMDDNTSVSFLDYNWNLNQQ